MFLKPVLPTDTQDADRAWDWLTALSPVLLMMVVNYGLSAVLAVLCATIGCLAASALWRLARVTAFRPVISLVCGVLATCCLPAAAPAWVALLAGLFGGVVGGIPMGINAALRKPLLVCPVYLPALSGYLLVRQWFGARLVGATVPTMWTPPDTVAGATPLAALNSGGVSEERLGWMFWGFDVGSMGSGPVLALLLGGAFVLLRRRAHVASPVAMLAVIALAFQWSMAAPAYGLLAGGTVLAALLLGDGVLIRVGWKGHLTAGVLGGLSVVLVRLRFGVDGAAVGVLTACLLTTVLGVVYRRLHAPMMKMLQKIIKSEN